ncbi:MAG: xanthine dehydrogenase accessory protein XdhC [Beijerinckiaceae bacterium]|jgi:xanthine dehydrogenase accessory factor|nr:xanthine dehydrogenase accessory protein XdhC [Beijerinckiaceae bacterium]
MLPPIAQFFRRVLDLVEDGQAVVVACVTEVRGSAPREEGAMMAVLADGSYFGTIGGGALEWQAQAVAARMHAEIAAHGRADARQMRRALGPDLGQCCGGHVVIDLLVMTRDKVPWLASRIRSAMSADARLSVALFGAGHVGRAVALALAPLPFRLQWSDSRAGAFPDQVPANCELFPGPDPVALIARTPPGALVLVMTHDHGLDLAITAAALSRDDLPFVGLIGSATKRARFVRQLRDLGLSETRLAALHCPVGLPGITGKEPAVIAAGIAAQLLVERSRMEPVSGPARKAVAAP